MDTLTEINQALLESGIETKLLQNSVAFETCRFLTVITTDEDEIKITCEIARDEEISDELTIHLLNLNTIILPFAFGILSPNTDGTDVTSLVLVDSIEKISATPEVLEAVLEKLRIALYNSGQILRQYGNYSTERAALYFDENELWEDIDLLDTELLIYTAYMLAEALDEDDCCDEGCQCNCSDEDGDVGESYVDAGYVAPYTPSVVSEPDEPIRQSQSFGSSYQESSISDNSYSSDSGDCGCSSCD